MYLPAKINNYYYDIHELAKIHHENSNQIISAIKKRNHHVETEIQAVKFVKNSLSNIFMIESKKSSQLF